MAVAPETKAGVFDCLRTVLGTKKAEKVHVFAALHEYSMMEEEPLVVVGSVRDFGQLLVLVAEFVAARAAAAVYSNKVESWPAAVASSLTLQGY